MSKDMTINRRKFLASTAVCGITASSAINAMGTKPQANSVLQKSPKVTRPNILVITTDQQWAGATSCEGNPYLKTPAIDSLARNGMQFEAAYSSNPICVPSRSSYMTGLMPHQVGVSYNFHEGDREGFEFTAPCLGKYFKDAGYDTGYIGKWHIPRAIEDKDWSGFDFLAEIRNNEVDFKIPAPAKEFINKKRSKPFLLFTSFVNPHDICEWARMASGIDDRLKNGAIGEVPPPQQCPPLRANNKIPDNEPAAIREHQSFKGLSGAYPTRKWQADDPRWRQYLWAYYRMVELVDSYIAEVLDALRQSGQEDNTLIIFTSDHGDGIGSHRWNQKTLFYDEIARIPFIVSMKGRTIAGSRNRDRLVNLGTDLCATLLDAAGIVKPDYLQGLSVLPAAMGKNSPEHKYIVSENNLHNAWAVAGNVEGRMVRSKRYKYVIYNNTSPNEQLFDMQLDPGETGDLSKLPENADILEQHRQYLTDYISKTNDNFTV